MTAHIVIDRNAAKFEYCYSLSKWSYDWCAFTAEQVGSAEEGSGVHPLLDRLQQPSETGEPGSEDGRRRAK